MEAQRHSNPRLPGSEILEDNSSSTECIAVDTSLAWRYIPLASLEELSIQLYLHAPTSLPEIKPIGLSLAEDSCGPK